MKKAKRKREKPMRAEYDFASMGPGEVGKYIESYRAGTNVVLLEPDVRRAFPTSARVNAALRRLIAARARKRAAAKRRPR
ncbi:MAG: hypothetical protein FJ091_00360 [Deltaproteobacteria bacterium]|nr:hypothetical protein [Deltaproteobacteria bacterium]